MAEGAVGEKGERVRGEAIATYVPGFWSWKDSN